MVSLKIGNRSGDSCGALLGECSVLISRKATSMSLRCGSAPLLVQTRARHRRHTVCRLPPRGTSRQSVMEFYHDSDHWRSATSTRLKTRRTMVAQAISNAAPLSRPPFSLSNHEPMMRCDLSSVFAPSLQSLRASR